ncbi:hypothetical protein ACFFYR_00160 [Paraburkholderia dipogonis]|uniref:hypothetical protein n=1 Tax=Paraburkholderia dipogonis TaxID=1211383 RepID=UPI0035ED6B9F
MSLRRRHGTQAQRSGFRRQSTPTGAARARRDQQQRGQRDQQKNQRQRGDLPASALSLILLLVSLAALLLIAARVPRRRVD